MARHRRFGHHIRFDEVDEALRIGHLCGVVSAGVMVGGMVVSSYMSSEATGDAVDAQKGMAESADRLTREQFDWNKMVYERDTKPAAEADAALRKKLVESQLATADKQTALADEQYTYWKGTFQPVEKRAVADAENYDSEENIAQRSGRAAAGVTQQFANSTAQRARLMTRLGLNPNSSTFATAVTADARNEALASAGAQTNAAFGMQDKAIALRSAAAGLGRGLTSNVGAVLASTSGTNQVTGNISAQGMGVQTASTAGLNSAYSSRLNGIVTSGNALTKGYGMEAAMWNDISKQFGQATSSAYGMGG
ncbi:MAG: hypothetical protein ABI574_00975 [Burkholderiales bacterium]